MCVLVHLYLE